MKDSRDVFGGSPLIQVICPRPGVGMKPISIEPWHRRHDNGSVIVDSPGLPPILSLCRINWAKNLHLPGPTGRSNLFKKKFIVLEGRRMGMRRTKEHKSARERPELMR